MRNRNQEIPWRVWFRRRPRTSFYFVLRFQLHFGYLCRIRDGVVMKKSTWTGIPIDIRMYDRVYPCTQLLHRGMYWCMRCAEGGYIGVSRGSVLPFYPNVISAKYENSYVLWYIRRRHRRQCRLIRPIRPMKWVHEAWAVSAGKYSA